MDAHDTRSSFILHRSSWPAQTEQSPRLELHFHHDRRLQTRMRDLVEQDHPAVFRRTFIRTSARHVHDLVIAEAALACDCHRLPAGVNRENPSLRTRRIFEIAESEEENRAEKKPGEVQRPPAAGTSNHGGIIRTMTRAEIEQELVTIVKQEKNVTDDLLRPETPLADAGIDSLDALNILFAVEERFRISIPDDRARAMKTFGDMIDIVQDLTAAA
jgi:acyl carrier protein